MDNVIVVETKLIGENEANDPLSLETVNGSKIDNGVIFIGSQDLNCQVDLGSSVTKCCVPNCATSRVNNINSSQITFVTFPKDPSRFTEWIRAIGRLDLLCFLGKKEATNLLICSKHFPQNMWVNSNTRLKRLHKNAVPELSYDDDIKIIAISPVNEKTLSAKKGGIKVKKVTSLLTDSALRESLSSPDKTSSSINMLSNSPVVDSPRLDIRGRKLPLILPRPKNLTASNTTPDVLKRPKVISRPSPKVTEPSRTELEKKLSLENKNLKEELDKNMDNILSQKAHYEGLISKEKQTIKELESKIKRLECSQHSLQQSYENQKQAKKQEAEIREMNSTIKHLQQLDESNRKRLEAERHLIQNLQAMNNELQAQIEDILQEKEFAAFTHTPAPNRPNFTGENFKDFLYLHLEKESNLKEKIINLMLQIDKSASLDGQKKNILNIASQHLNHLHLSWLKWILNIKERTEIDFDDRLREFALSIYEVSRDAYFVCAKAFGLPSHEVVEKWAKDASSSKGATTSTINALYDEAQTLPTTELLNQSTCDSDKGYDDALNSEGKRRKSHWKQRFYCKKLKSHIDDEEEGRVSDEDEEVVFTDSEDEDEDGLESDEDEIVAKEETLDSKEITSSSKINLPVASTSSQDFDFIVEGESLEVQRGETCLVSENLQPEQHVHMPLLNLDSSMTTQRDIVNGNSATDLKISNRKKIISSDSSVPSGSKVVFRVIES